MSIPVPVIVIVLLKGDMLPLYSIFSLLQNTILYLQKASNIFLQTYTYLTSCPIHIMTE